MPYTLVCPACRTNVLYGDDTTFWLMDGYVVRHCRGCNATVRVVKQASWTCTRWGPLRWAGVKYCRQQAAAVAVRPHFDPVANNVDFDYLCEKHRHEPESLGNGSGFLMFAGATVFLGIFGLAVVHVPVQVARSLFPLPVPNDPPGWIRTIVGAIVGVASALVPTIVVLRTHFTRLEDP